MKRHTQQAMEAEIPGWDLVEETMLDLRELEPPEHLARHIMAAVATLPIPVRLEPMAEHHRADLGRTLVYFAAILSAGGLLCLWLAPGLFFAIGDGLWYLLQGAFGAAVGVGGSLGLLSDALADKAWQAAPLAFIAAVLGTLALEWRVLSRVLAGRMTSGS